MTGVDHDTIESATAAATVGLVERFSDHSRALTRTLFDAATHLFAREHGHEAAANELARKAARHQRIAHQQARGRR